MVIASESQNTLKLLATESTDLLLPKDFRHLDLAVLQKLSFVVIGFN